ncbi:MAG TPA: monovalent cation/H+ antiporter complex subunit F [Vicinamibacterales bacterium]|nr:monovalent cation/H+ antiporter complex subunit F [Vicinamibacterales bacterium]
MSGVFLWATLITLFLMMPFVSRVITGPTIFDRVVALNGLGTLVPATLVLVGLLYDRVDMFVDLALALFLLNVFTTLLIARYVRERAEAK